MRFHLPPSSLPNREIERAQQYDWPGNVRELQNVVERAVIISHGGKLTLDLPQTGKGSASRENRSVAPVRGALVPESVVPEKAWRERERSNVLAALRQANFQISGKGGAADLLGINPGTLTSRLKALRIDRRDHVE